MTFLNRLCSPWKGQPVSLAKVAHAHSQVAQDLICVSFSHSDKSLESTSHTFERLWNFAPLRWRRREEEHYGLGCTMNCTLYHWWTAAEKEANFLNRGLHESTCRAVTKMQNKQVRQAGFINDKVFFRRSHDHSSAEYCIFSLTQRERESEWAFDKACCSYYSWRNYIKSISN